MSSPMAAIYRHVLFSILCLYGGLYEVKGRNGVYCINRTKLISFYLLLILHEEKGRHNVFSINRTKLILLDLLYKLGIISITYYVITKGP